MVLLQLLFNVRTLLKSEPHFITNQVKPQNMYHYRSGNDTMAENAKIYHSRLAISHCVLYTSCQHLIYRIQNCQEVEWSSTHQKVDGSVPEPWGVLGHNTKSHILWGVCEWFHLFTSKVIPCVAACAIISSYTCDCVMSKIVKLNPNPRWAARYTLDKWSFRDKLTRKPTHTHIYRQKSHQLTRVSTTAQGLKGTHVDTGRTCRW